MVATRSVADSSDESSPDVTRDFLEIEYKYVTDSSFHTDELRDRFIQFYLVLVGVSFTLMVGLAEVTALDPLIYALIAMVLFIVGVILIAIFVRLRRVVVECYMATALIKEYYKKHTHRRDDLINALLWDEQTVPRLKENPISASSLLVLLVAILDSSMLGTAVFLLLARPDLLQGKFPTNVWPITASVIVLFLVSASLQLLAYLWRVSVEKRDSVFSQRQRLKAKYWGIDTET